MRTRDIRESDWKLCRELRSVALNRLCSRALTKVGEDVGGSSSPYEKFMLIFKTLDDTSDRMRRIFDNPRRSTARLVLFAWRAEGLITDEELNRFSKDLRDVVKARERM